MGVTEERRRKKDDRELKIDYGELTKEDGGLLKTAQILEGRPCSRPCKKKYGKTDDLFCNFLPIWPISSDNGRRYVFSKMIIWK